MEIPSFLKRGFIRKADMLSKALSAVAPTMPADKPDDFRPAEVEKVVYDSSSGGLKKEGKPNVPVEIQGEKGEINFKN